MRRSSFALVSLLLAGVVAVAPAAGAPEQTPKRGGTVVIAIPAHFEQACLNPLVDACSPDYLDLVLAGAYDVRPDGTFRARLASGRVVARRPFTLLYDIRPEASWSDGASVTARDFVFTHQAISRHRPEFAGFHLDAGIRSVRALDAKTVRVVLRAPRADWPELFSFVLPRHALAGHDLAKVWQDAIDNPNTGAPIGSGPFLVDRLDRTRQLVLRRNPRYWGPHLAHLDRIAVRFVPPADVADAMRHGEVDMIVPGPPVFLAPTLELYRQGMPGIRRLSIRLSSWENLSIRIGPGGHPALKNKLVRQALAFGIDREAIARVALEFAGKPDAKPEPLDSVVFLANSRYYRPNWNRYRYRPEQAQRLLALAGCRLGADRIYVCAGEKLSLRFVTSAGSERRKRTLELAAAHLRATGVEAVPQYVPPIHLGTMVNRGDFDLFQFGFGSGPTTIGPLGIFGCQQRDNVTGYCDRLMTRDLDQAMRVLDDERWVPLLHRIDARLAAAVPAIPLFQLTTPFVFDASIRGVRKNGVGRFTWNAEDWWLAR